jgi:hypothetical protein
MHQLLRVSGAIGQSVDQALCAFVSLSTGCFCQITREHSSEALKMRSDDSVMIAGHRLNVELPYEAGPNCRRVVGEMHADGTSYKFDSSIVKSRPIARQS